LFIQFEYNLKIALAQDLFMFGVLSFKN